MDATKSDAAHHADGGGNKEDSFRTRMDSTVARDLRRRAMLKFLLLSSLIVIALLLGPFAIVGGPGQVGLVIGLTFLLVWAGDHYSRVNR